MMFRRNAVSVSVLLSALWELTVALPSPHEFTLTWKRQNGNETFNATTTFRIYECDANNQVPAIKQAHKDALDLANAVFYDDRELSIGNPHQLIDFKSQAAIDYFGPSDFEPSQHQRIYDTLYRATNAYSGWGLDDWWNGRYIDIWCNDFANDCEDKKTGDRYTAYTNQWDPNTKMPRTWPRINYCPAFFDSLKSHGDAITEIDDDKTGRKKLNTKNMRTQATTALHEWMHINNNFTAMICNGGCNDTIQWVGGVRTNTYKSGRAKLLARKDPVLAAKTNDNLAYFATALFMEKKWGVYPEYPLAWDNGKTPAQNKMAEKLQPGDPDGTPDTILSTASTILSTHSTTFSTPSATSSNSATNPTTVADGDPNVDGTPVASVASDAPLLAASKYPDWYQPVLSAAGSSTLPAISRPTPPSIGPTAQVNLSAVQCNYVVNPNITDPTYDDCVKAFAPTFDFANATWSSQPPKQEKWVTAYSGQTSGTCALTIEYGGDWTGCNATYGDVWAHARVVFEACADYGKGTVGGSVPFSVSGCPGNVSITHTVEAIS